MSPHQTTVRVAPVQPKAGELRGRLDRFETGDGFVYLSGWIVASDKSSAVEPLTIVIDGRKFGPIPLEFRPDFKAAGIAGGKAGFAVALPLQMRGSIPRIIVADAVGSWALLDTSACEQARFVPRGAIDDVAPEGVSGWVFDPAAVLGSGKVTLSVNGGKPQPVTLGFDRDDVPFTLIAHPRRFGFRSDVGNSIGPALRQAAIDGKPKTFAFELSSSGQTICAHSEVFTPAKESIAPRPVPSPQTIVEKPGPGVKLARPNPAAGSSISVAKAPVAQRPRMLVVSWDMGHNPAGRAYLLADMARRHFDVKMIGPVFEQYGKALWEPLRDQTSVPIETFPGGDLAAYLRTVVEQVERNPADVVYVSKPRLPSLLFGLMMRVRHGAKLIVDVDDHELSFFDDDKPLSLDTALRRAREKPANAEMPYANVWTQLGETLVALADGVTVSNVALQDRFGGVVVRHARDENIFSVDDERRREVRKEFGLSEADRAIVFVGTPRTHKGIYRIADALERLNNDRLVFVMVGSFTDARTKDHFKKYKKARIKYFPNQPWARLPELVGMADAVAILQDRASRVCEFQIPAKLTDAMALGVPILATRVPPLADLLDKNALLVVDQDRDLDRFLKKLASPQESFTAQTSRARSQFLCEFSYSVNASRIELTVNEAGRNGQRPVQETATVLQRLFDFAGVAYPYGKTGSSVARPAIRRADRPRDLVFFWKQNDSDLYGRRSDMMVKYLLQSGRIRRVIHFDRSLTLSELEASIDRSPQAQFHQGNLVYLNSLRRIFRMADRGAITRRTFLCRNGSIPQSFLGVDLPPRSAYPEFVKETLRECGVDAPPIAWVCPVVFDFPAIAENVEFEKVVVDIIDDQRKWQAKPDYMERVARNYADVLKDADLALANCDAVSEGFADLRNDIAVVPNGTEVFAPERTWPVPDDLADLPRPIIGYVGNLRDRIDFELIRKMALQHPDWSIVLVGSAQGALDVFTLADIPNIRLMGVRPYEEALAYIRNFDVAIMPHINNELSQNMNPLKLYVYFALGVPVVTTEVANIDDIGPYVAVAGSHGQFIAAVEDALKGKGQQLDPDERTKVLTRVSWTSRVREILSRMDL